MEKIKNFLEQITRIHLSFLNNVFSFLYILFELSTDKKGQKRIYLLKDLICKFEDDDIIDSYYLFKDSVKQRNSIIFQVIIFLYCAIIEDYLLPLLNTFLSYKIVYNEVIYQKFIDKLNHLIDNNFNYQYVREYSKYDYYDNKVIFKVIVWETLLNVSGYINYWFGNLKRKNKYIIDTDYFFYKCERYF